MENKLQRTDKLKFANKMNELMILERDAEIEQTSSLLSKYSFKELEKRNLALCKLEFKMISTGVFGRFLVHLVRK